MNINFEDHEVEALRDWIEEVDNLVREDTTLAPRIKKVYEILDKKTAPKTIEVTGFHEARDALRTATCMDTKEIVTLIGLSKDGKNILAQDNDGIMSFYQPDKLVMSSTPRRVAIPSTTQCEIVPHKKENIGKHYLVAVEDTASTPKAIAKAELDGFCEELVFNIEEVYGPYDSLIEPGDTIRAGNVVVLGEVEAKG